MSFQDKLKKIVNKNNSLLCVGLDPDLDKFPKHILKKEDPIFEFNKAIIDVTSDLACGYKPNIAFYEANGEKGHVSLKKTIEYLKNNFPEIPIILDAKRADIGNTAKMYAKASFEYWKADAVTVLPYLGLDSVEPFLQYHDKSIILIIKTSNNDSKMFQDLNVNNKPFFISMAKIIKTWNYSNISVFVGATYPNELKKIREIFPNTPILTAGIGAQKADLKKVINAGVDTNAGNLICNVSREIIYSSNNLDFYKIARQKAKEIKDIINLYR